jgi:acetyl esterase
VIARRGLSLIAILASLQLGSCAAFIKGYMDAIDEKFPEMRTMIASIPPATHIRMARAEEISIDGAVAPLKARLYVPPSVRGNTPVILYMHGGGFVIGSYTHVDELVRAICAKARCPAVSIDYRLAPEHPYPSGLDDAMAAFDWLAAKAADLGSAPDRIVVAGESAGGNLAAALSQRRRDRGMAMPLAQILLYPAVGNADPDTGEPWPSRAENADKSILTPKSLESFGRLYLGDPALYARDPYVNPLFAKSFAGLPPALVATCGLDPLRDEGEAYARKLTAAGVPVAAKRFEGKDHGYMGDDLSAFVASFIDTL